MSAAGPRFVLFAHPRSGSSSLLQALRQHPRIQIAEEPFHERYKVWTRDEPNYADLVSDVSSLDQQLDALFSKYNGIKVLDYQLAGDLYTHLLLKQDIKVIALRRRNLLQSVISGHIAQQSGIWKIWDLNGTLDNAYRDLKPIPMDVVRERLSYMSELREFYIRVLSEKPSDMRLELEYEALFTSCVEENIERLTGIFRFLELEAIEPEKVTFYLDPKKSKINNDQFYQYLPNAKEVNDEFGSDETGWLLEGNHL